MKRALLLLSFSLCLLAACEPAREPVLQGYVEGEYVYLAAPQAGYLQQLATPRGSRVAAGQQLFVLAPDLEMPGVAGAEAKVRSARESLDNLSAPRRSQEIAVLQAQLQAAEAALKLSTIQLQQQEALAQRQFVSPVKLDEARATQTHDAAQVAEVKRQIALYQSSFGRNGEVRAAAAEVEAASADLAQKRWQLASKTQLAPQAGEIADTYFRVGEWVPAGSPVLALLPDPGRRLRFFVGEAMLGAVKVGDAVVARCDGCAAPVRARIDFVATQAEYTPPVIYSQDNRQRLVYRVEAVPEAGQPVILKPGQPIDVSLAGER